MNYKYGQLRGFQIGAKLLQIGIGSSNWGIFYKSGEKITNRCRAYCSDGIDKIHKAMEL